MSNREAQIHSFEITPEIAAIEPLQQEIEGYTKGILTPSNRFKLNLAIDEIIVNVISHSDAGGMPINIMLEIKEQLVCLTIADIGPAFDPFTDAPEPDTAAPLEERKIGGLGLMIIKETIDQYSYERQGNQNVIRLMLRADIDE